MDEHNKITIDQFTRQAAPFSLSQSHANAASLRFLMDAAQVSSDDVVLDVACGTGMVACAFAEVAKSVTGIDLTPAMLEKARELAIQKGLTNLTWNLGDIETLPYPDNTFSIVVSRYAFHHLQRPAEALLEMARVCRPDGRVLIADALPASEKADAYNRFEKLFDPSHNRALTPEEMARLLDLAGLNPLTITYYRMEMEFERHLAASFPNPGDGEKLRQILLADIGLNRIGVGARLEGDEIRYAYPVTVICAYPA